MKAGVLPERFWKYSIAEVQDILQGMADARERNLKERLWAAAYQVDELSRRIGIMLGSEEKPKTLSDYFPELFREESAAQAERKRQEELAECAEARRTFAERHNKKVREGAAGQAASLQEEEDAG